MLARKEPATTRLDAPPVTQLDDKDWAGRVRAGAYVELFSELATLLRADKIEDVRGTAVGDINTALRADGALKPGLNFVGRFDSRGQCGYLYGGTFRQQLPVTRDGELPQVALALGRLAFDADNKAFTLGVLRHELEHALHNRMALNWLKRWRADEKAARQPFLAWLAAQPLSGTDRALVKERVADTKENTEALANLEGFKAAFTVERPGLGLADHPAVEELADVGRHWLRSDKAVRAEVASRLRDFAAALSGERRATFRETLRQLKAGDAALAPLVDPLLGMK
jgi:hypothetical protein